MIKLIASDVDGTLVRDGTMEINPEIFDVIATLHQRGIQFAVASGRHWTSVESLFKPIESKVFYLADNGAYVGMHGRNLFMHTIDRENADILIQMIRDSGNLTVLASNEDGFMLEKENPKLMDWMRNGYHGRCELVPDLMKLENIIKISAYDPESNIAVNGRKIKEAMEGRLQIGDAGTMWLDCNAKGVSKGEAIRVLQDSLGIKPEETMVFGDQENDISMLQSAYYSFAVKNAVPGAKKAARFEADSNVCDGVLKILKTLL